MIKNIIIGTGGHSRVIIDALELNGIKIDGIYDLDFKIKNKKNTIFKYKVDGGIEDVRKIQNKKLNIYLAIGDNQIREKIYKKFSIDKYNYPKLIHPNALVSSKARIKMGAFINSGVIVNAGATIDEFTIINTSSIIDHETKIGSFSQVCPGCVIAGRVNIGSGSFIGIGTNIIDNIKIVSNTIIGAGSVVINSITNSGTYLGTPAKKVKWFIFLQAVLNRET